MRNPPEDRYVVASLLFVLLCASVVLLASAPLLSLLVLAGACTGMLLAVMA